VEHKGIKIELIGRIGDFSLCQFFEVLIFSADSLCLFSSHSLLLCLLAPPIELFFDRGNDYVFLSREQNLQPAGVLEKSTSIDFNFANLELQNESYNGINVRLRYFLQVSVAQGFLGVTKEKELWVQTFEKPAELNPPIKMEVGVENALHIEFEFNHSRCVLLIPSLFPHTLLLLNLWVILTSAECT